MLFFVNIINIRKREIYCIHINYKKMLFSRFKRIKIEIIEINIYNIEIEKKFKMKNIYKIEI